MHDADVHRENQPCVPTLHADHPLFPGKIKIQDRVLVAEGVCLGKVDYVSPAIRQAGLVTRAPLQLYYYSPEKGEPERTHERGH